MLLELVSFRLLVVAIFAFYPELRRMEHFLTGKGLCTASRLQNTWRGWSS